MFTRILLGTATALLIAGQASALTMTPTSDNRETNASAMAGEDSDFQNDFPSPAFSDFASESFATANEFGFPDLIERDALGGGGGGVSASASANARQGSTIGALSISGSGSTNAEGNHGNFIPTHETFGGGGGGFLGGSFSASANSILDVLFSIDESAAFDLEGFLSAGIELAVGANGNDVSNGARVLLKNTDTDAVVFSLEVSDDSSGFNESGVIGAGNYLFSVIAFAEVLGQGVVLNQALSDADEFPDYPEYPVYGYSTAASFEANLNLEAIDKPIPEPVTTTLAGLGLGALALQTTRRRRA